MATIENTPALSGTIIYVFSQNELNWDRPGLEKTLWITTARRGGGGGGMIHRDPPVILLSKSTMRCSSSFSFNMWDVRFLCIKDPILLNSVARGMKRILDWKLWLHTYYIVSRIKTAHLEPSELSHGRSIRIHSN